MADKGGLLARSDFPLYVVKALDERHFLVAGGGGAAKTGIANAIVSYFKLVIQLTEQQHCINVHVIYSHPSMK